MAIFTRRPNDNGGPHGDTRPPVAYADVATIAYPHVDGDGSSRLRASAYYCARAAVWDRWVAPDSAAPDPADVGGAVVLSELWAHPLLQRVCDGDRARLDAALQTPDPVLAGLSVSAHGNGDWLLTLDASIFRRPEPEPEPEPEPDGDAGWTGGLDGLGTGDGTGPELRSGVAEPTEYW